VSPEEQAQRRERFRSSLEEHYQRSLTEDDRNNLITDPAQVVPKMMANAHMAIVEATIYGVMQEMPNVVRNYLARDSQQKRDEQEFFSMHKELDNAEGRAAAGRIAAAYLNANPAAKREVAIKEIGALTRQAMGIGVTAPVPMPPPPPSPAAGIGSPTMPTAKKPQGSVLEQFYEDVASEDGRGT